MVIYKNSCNFKLLANSKVFGEEGTRNFADAYFSQFNETFVDAINF